MEDRFPAFVREFMLERYGSVDGVPDWIINALESVNITFEGREEKKPRIHQGN